MAKPSESSYLAGIRSGWARAPGMARIALRLGQSGGARLFGGRHNADAKLGEQLLRELDQLKGMAMKVGQILSYMDVGLPAEVSAQLSQLQRGVTPLPAERIIAVVEAELGRPLGELFSRFDERALAAASIGQVHRACTAVGEEVVVKVRYPDIEQSFEGDFQKLGRLGALAGSFSAVDGRALVAELAARVREECDYTREAAWQRLFAEIFADDAAIVVPRVLPRLCSAGVLTSDYCEGETFESFCATADGPARQRVARALLRFALLPLLRHGVLHADPHPGNQLFSRAGIVALDYGCVRRFEDEPLAQVRALYRAVLAGRREAFRPVCIALGLAPRPEKLDFDELWRMYRWMLEPLWRERFVFTRAWWLEGRAFSSPTAKNARHQGMPPLWIWWQRVQWGLWALLLKLRAEGNFGEPVRQWLAAPLALAPPLRPME